jgi:hypothetical protein
MTAVGWKKGKEGKKTIPQEYPPLQLFLYANLSATQTS